MKTLTAEEAMYKAAAYCSRSEHSTQEMATKLEAWGVAKELHDKIIDRLIAEKFIDDRRFCRSYINDKYKYSRWGRIKIMHNLRTKGISTSLFKEVEVETIDTELYFENLKAVLKEKLRSTKASTPYELKGKLVRSAASKGYEPNLIYMVIDELLD